MNLRDLQYLAFLAEYKHFGRAAEAAHVSQPTLSSQIKKLEDELGVALFERDSRNVALTPAGQDVLAEVKSLLAHVDAIKDIGTVYRDPLGGRFRLGVIASLGPFVVPDILEQLKFDAPRLDVHVREGLTESLLADVAARKLDAVLMATDVDGEMFNAFDVFDEPFLVAVPEGHMLARKDSVSMGDIAKENLLLLEEGHCLRDQALALCMAPTRDERVKAASLVTLVELVQRGQGVTLLPALAAGLGSGIVLKPLKGAGAMRSVKLVTRKTVVRPGVLEVVRKAIMGIGNGRLKVAA